MKPCKRTSGFTPGQEGRWGTRTLLPILSPALAAESALWRTVGPVNENPALCRSRVIRLHGPRIRTKAQAICACANRSTVFGAARPQDRGRHPDSPGKRILRSTGRGQAVLTLFGQRQRFGSTGDQRSILRPAWSMSIPLKIRGCPAGFLIVGQYDVCGGRPCGCRSAGRGSTPLARSRVSFQPGGIFPGTLAADSCYSPCIRSTE